jgi:hypothetical protein
MGGDWKSLRILEIMGGVWNYLRILLDNRWVVEVPELRGYSWFSIL